jgi:hypothetical protein
MAPPLADIEKFDAKVLYAEFRARMDKEAQAAGLTGAPWLYDRFAERLATTIERRAISRFIGAEFRFDWQERPDSWWVGDPANGGIEVFTNSPDVDVPKLKQQFEQLMKDAERWPEATKMTTGPIGRGMLYELAEPLLAAAANTDPITSRCFLCGGGAALAQPDHR